MLATARAAVAGDGIDPDVYSHPVGFHGHGAGRAVGQWDQLGGVPGAVDYAVHPDTVYPLELAVRCPVPEWEGQCVRIAVEEGIAVTSGGVDYLDVRLTPPGYQLAGFCGV